MNTGSECGVHGYMLPGEMERGVLGCLLDSMEVFRSHLVRDADADNYMSWSVMHVVVYDSTNGMTWEASLLGKEVGFASQSGQLKRKRR